MYTQASPRSPRYDHLGQVKVSGLGMGIHSAVAGASSVLSPGRSRRHRAGSNQGSRSGSPLTLQMESAGFGGSASDMSRSYYGESLNASHSPVPSPGSSRSPFQSPAHSRSSSMTSVKSLLRDRSMDRSGTSDREFLHRYGNHPHHERSTSAGGVLIRDRSLDRQLDRHYRDGDKIQHSLASSRDRSIDREYPHMGARSLERENHHPLRHGNLVRSRSIDHEYMANQAAFMPSNTDLRFTSENRTVILDLQSNVADLTKECFTYQQELDVTKEKLGSSMNSIKTFWSPELKKERAIRKEESARLSKLADEFRVTKAENQKFRKMLERHEEELSSFKNSRFACSASGAGDFDSLQKDKQKQAKEIHILRKTVEEMELRIETQKQTLSARDESIKKLLEMLQSKGLVTQHVEEDRAEVEQLQMRLLEENQRMRHLDAALEDKEQELQHMREYTSAALWNSHHKMDMMKRQEEARQIQLEADKMRREAGTEALEAMVESKDLHISSLEREIKVVEDELLRIREEGTVNGPDARNGKLQIETLKSQEKLLKAKIENVRAELARKETELAGQRARVESLNRQGSDHQQHIAVLREQISAKDQQINLLQTDIETMRGRLEEKDEAIDKKSKQTLQVQTEKKRMETEVYELRDHMDIKERKINVLQRKVDNLEELMRDKESQLESQKQRLNSLHGDHNSLDNSLSSMERSIAEKDKQIERLKEQRDRIDREHTEETDMLQRANKELKSKIDAVLNELDEKQHNVLELREEASEMRSDKIRKDNRIGQFELTLSQKSADIQNLSDQIKKLEEEKAELQAKGSQEAELRGAGMEKELAAHKELAAKTQTEVDRLLDILKQMEEEKTEKDKQIKDLQEQVKDNKSKAGTLRRSQQKSAQMLEEARKRQEEVTGDVTQLKNVIKQNVERIEELEEALRESVKITAQREMVMAEQQMNIDHTEKQMQKLNKELQGLSRENTDRQDRITTLHIDLEAKENQLRQTQAERRKQLEGLYEMKQEAIVAAISEKDAHIALLEMAPGPKPITTRDEVERLNKEKAKLQEQLKELTQSRMKLIQTDDDKSHNGTPVTKKMAKANPEQEEEDGIWA